MNVELSYGRSHKSHHITPFLRSVFTYCLNTFPCYFLYEVRWFVKSCLISEIKKFTLQKTTFFLQISRHFFVSTVYTCTEAVTDFFFHHHERRLSLFFFSREGLDIHSFFVNNQTNFRLYDEQKVNGLKKNAWASIFYMKWQYIYICVCVCVCVYMYMFVYAYLYI